MIVAVLFDRSGSHVPDPTVAVLVIAPPLLRMVTKAVIVRVWRSPVFIGPIVQTPVPGTYALPLVSDWYCTPACRRSLTTTFDAVSGPRFETSIV